MQPNLQEPSSEDRKKRKSSEESNSEGQANQQEDESKEEQEVSSKKRQRGWVEKQSKVSKVFINNRRQQKFLQVDPSCQGIFLYKPGVELPSLFHFSNQSIKVLVSSQYVKKHNPELLKKNIVGTDTYTSNSDCLCIAIHSGLININNFVNKKYEGIELSFKIIKPKKNYTGSTKNGITSRNIKGYNGNALKPDGYRFLTTLGPIQNLEKYAANMHIPIGKTRSRSAPKNIRNTIPIPQTHMVFNMNSEPAYKYSIINLADKGFEDNQFLTAKLNTHSLYLETKNQEKYELTKFIEPDTEIFQFSKIKEPLNCDNNYFTTAYAPFDSTKTQVIFKDLQWGDIQWGNESLKIKDLIVSGLSSFKYHRKNVKG